MGISVNILKRSLIRCVFCLVVFTSMLGRAIACTENEIATSDNKCIPTAITLTLNVTSSQEFKIEMTATGTFYIDWGDGSTVNPISRYSTSTGQYKKSYSTTGTKTVRLGGEATGYYNGQTTPAIKFTPSNKNRDFITKIEGSFETMFPILGSDNTQQPRFYRSFYNCANLTSISPTLFSYITTTSNYTFYGTFQNCSSLANFIPPSLFGGLIQNNHPYGTSMMANIFYNTNLITSCNNATNDGHQHRAYTTGYESYWNSKVSCATEYNITYELDGGTNYANAPTTYWDAPEQYWTAYMQTINGVPTKSNHIFIGWCTDSALTDCAATQNIPIYTAGDKTFYAKWEACPTCATTNASCALSVVSNTCTYTTTCNTGYENIQNNGAYNASCSPISYSITYNMNNGTNYTNAPATYTYGVGATIDGIPTKTGYTFAGWCTDSNLTNCAMTQTIPVNSMNTKTFYAKWQPCTACATTNASCTLSVVNNTCTYTTACNTGYENIQNNGAYNASCSAITPSGPCQGGYYKNNSVCVPVGPGYWSADNSDTRSQCPTGLTTIGYGAGADEQNDCGRTLQLGNYTLYLRQNRKTDRTLNVQIGNNIYYANMSTSNIKMTANTDHYLKAEVNGTEYSVYDDSGQEYTSNNN